MAAGVDRFCEAVEGLLCVDFSALSGPEKLDVARRLERGRRLLAAVDHRLLAEMESSCLAGDYARSSTVDLLVSELRVTPAEARSRVAHAADLGPRRTLTGEPLEPLLPVCAQATAEGLISPQHVSVIVKALEQVPAELDPVICEVVEATLVDAACHEHPGQLAKTAVLLLDRINPDGVLTREKDHDRNRDFSLAHCRDGSGRMKGHLTPEATAVWDVILDCLSPPVPAEDGAPDERTAGQRMHDGLLEAGRRPLRSGDLPAAGGVPVTILVRTTAADLVAAAAPADEPRISTAAGIGLTTRGDVLSLRSLLDLGDVDIVPVLVADHGDVLRLGRTRRLANRPIRLALAVRDGGCCFPGCSKPASWTEVHHIREWQTGGATDIDNLCLLCRVHHREFEARGWQVRMTDGVPEWTPPPWLDPDEQPRRNTAHHPPDLQFAPIDLPAA